METRHNSNGFHLECTWRQIQTWFTVLIKSFTSLPIYNNTFWKKIQYFMSLLWGSRWACSSYISRWDMCSFLDVQNGKNGSKCIWIRQHALFYHDKLPLNISCLITLAKKSSWAAAGGRCGTPKCPRTWQANGSWKYFFVFTQWLPMVWTTFWG